MLAPQDGVSLQMAGVPEQRAKFFEVIVHGNPCACATFTWICYVTCPSSSHRLNMPFSGIASNRCFPYQPEVQGLFIVAYGITRTSLSCVINQLQPSTTEPVSLSVFSVCCLRLSGSVPLPVCPPAAPCCRWLVLGCNFALS